MSTISEEDEYDLFHIGDTVQIVDLKTHKFNGRIAEIEGPFLIDTKRWPVQLKEDNQEKLAIHSFNLQKVMPSLYQASYSTGIYGSYSLKYHKHRETGMPLYYKPSANNGSFGSYTINTPMSEAEQKQEHNNIYSTLVFIRHGQSQWNASNQFTGWVDVGLTELGKQEALAGANELLKSGLEFDIMYTSYLKRAIITGNMVLEAINQLYIPITQSWRLNERMYGALQGLNKAETVEKHGKEQVLIWRRSFDVPPPEIDEKSQYNPANDVKYSKLNKNDIPKTECLKDVIARAEPFWKSDIEPKLKQGKTILVAAHGNSIRAIVKYLDNIDDKIIPSLEIPTGIPLVYQFDKDLNIIPNAKAVKPLTGLFLGDPERIKKAQEKVKNQISKK